MGCSEKGTSNSLLRGILIWFSLFEKQYGTNSQHIENVTTLWPRNSTPSKPIQEHIQKISLNIFAYAQWTIIYNSKDLKTTKMPNNRWVNKKKTDVYIRWKTTQLQIILHSTT